MISKILGFLILSGSLWAAIPKSPSLSFEKVLAQKSESKFDTLKKMGPQVYSRLRDVSFNEDKPLGMRWQAFMAMVRIGEKEAIPEIDKALKSKDWFMRDAALKVLPVLDTKKSFQASMKALTDPALIVRTSAVLALKQIKAKEAKPQLWQELYSRENYMKKQSLWIRRHIVETLSTMADKADVAQFVKVLDDEDTTLLAPAIGALESVTGQKLGDQELQPVYKRHLWKKWFESQKATKAS